MVGLIERRADEVVHPGIGDYEGLAPIAFEIQDLGQQSAGLRDQEAAGLQQESYLQPGQGAIDLGRILCHFSCRVELGAIQVVDAQATPGIDELDADAVSF